MDNNKILKEVAEKLKNEQCKICSKTAKIIVTGKSIKFETCCKDFEKILKPKADKLIEEISNREIKKELDNMFKGH